MKRVAGSIAEFYVEFSSTWAICSHISAFELLFTFDIWHVKDA